MLFPRPQPPATSLMPQPLPALFLGQPIAQPGYPAAQQSAQLRQPALPAASPWSAAPGPPPGWHEASAAAAARAAFAGMHAAAAAGMRAGAGTLAQQQQQQQAGLHAAFNQPPPPPPPAVRRSDEFELFRSASFGTADKQQQAAAPRRPLGAADLGAGQGCSSINTAAAPLGASSLFAHPVFEASPRAADASSTASSTPHSARAAQQQGSLAFGAEPAFATPYSGLMPPPIIPGGLASVLGQQPPLLRHEDAPHAPLQLTQSHFGPTVSSNAGGGGWGQWS
jgi:hypothetical protein